MQRDSGLLEYARTRDAIRKLDEALDELRKKGVLMFFKTEDRTGERGRILDVSYTITPDPGFVSQIKAANKRHSDGVEQINVEIGVAESDEVRRSPAVRKR